MKPNPGGDRRPRCLPLGAIAAGFGLFNATALAQSVAPPAAPATPAAASGAKAGAVRDGAELPTISVKARAETDQNSVRATTSTIGRGNQDLRDIPQSVTVVTEKLMEDRRADTVKEALHHTAGITFQAAEGGEEDIRLRGFSLTASGDIFIDGVRDPAFYDRDVFAFDRIELLRGSASMLFGRGSTGGVVNQVSKKALLTDVSEVSTTIGSGSLFRVTGDFNIRTSATSAVRLNAMTTTADNFGNRIDKVGVAPTFRWGIGTDDEFSVGYFALQNDNGINYGIPWLRKNDGALPISATNPGVLVPIDPRNVYAAASDYNAGTASYGTLDYTHRFAGGAWHTVVRHGGYSRDQRASAVRFCVRSATANLDCPAVAPSLSTISDATPLTLGTNNKVQDLRSTYVQTDVTKAVSVLGRSHELLAGVDLAREAFDNYTLTLPAGVVLDKNTPRTRVGAANQGPSVDESRRLRVLSRNFVARALGVYVQDLVEIAPHWKLLAGLRWDRFEGRYFAPAAAPELQHLGRTDSLLSERLGLLWQPSDAVSTYLSWGTSFNPSGELFLYDLPGSKAPPEKSRNLELGAKVDLFDGRLSTRVSLFHSVKTNERNRDSPTGQPLEDFLLAGRRHASGLELDLAGRVTSAWEVYGSYAWIPSARIDKAAEFGTVSGEQVGQRPSLSPRHSGTLFTTVQLTPSWRVGGGINARGPQTPNRNPAGIVAPGFVTADLLAEFAFAPTVALKMNLLNVANTLVADSLYTGHYVPGQPRTFSATLTARF